MRTSYYFCAVITVIFSLLLLALGVFFIALPNAPEFLSNLIAFLQAGHLLLQFVGVCITLLGVILLISCFLVSRREHYLVSFDKKGTVEIDALILQQYTEKYFKELFDGFLPHIEVALKKGKIHLLADLPSIPDDTQKQFIENIEVDLHKLYEKQFGYKDDFYLSVSFSS